MKRVFGVAVVCGFLASVGMQTVAGKDDKVTICHKAPGLNYDITVSASAVPAHLAHGDTVGSCGSGQPATCDDNPVCF